MAIYTEHVRLRRVFVFLDHDTWIARVQESEGGGCDETDIEGVFFENTACGDNLGREIHNEKHDEILGEI